MRSVMKQWRWLAGLAIVAVLASCYSPDKFRSELRLSRFGDYSLSFEGDFIYVPILHDYADGKITPENEEERHQNIYRDLVRDPAITDLRRSGKGRFHARYERQGRLGPTQLVALFNRNARMLSMKSNENGTLVVAANSLKASDAQRMIELGVGMEGEFRITTDAVVLQHNASEVRSFQNNYRVYIWKIENPLSPMPRLVIRRDDDPTRPLAPSPADSNEPQ